MIDEMDVTDRIESLPGCPVGRKQSYLDSPMGKVPAAESRVLAAESKVLTAESNLLTAESNAPTAESNALTAVDRVLTAVDKVLAAVDRVLAEKVALRRLNERLYEKHTGGFALTLSLEGASWAHIRALAAVDARGGIDFGGIAALLRERIHGTHAYSGASVILGA